MKIGLIIEYFPPFTFGGSEWSTYYLAKELAKINKNQVFVFTPNFGAQSEEEINNFKIIRFPFYHKFKKNQSLPTSYYFLNPIWILWVAWQVLVLGLKYKLDVLHISGKYSIIPTRIANFILRRKIVATVRDYQIICNYGFCLYQKYKSCNLVEYFTKDFTYYVLNYLPHKGLINILINLIYAISARLNIKLLRLFSKNLKIIVLSKAQKRIFIANGFSDVEYIYNSIDLNKPKKSRDIRNNNILYIGRLTPGKGVKVLIKVFNYFFKKHPNYKFLVIGEGPQFNNIKDVSLKIRNVKLLGQLPHGKILKLISKSQVVVVPSLWPEPFGRVALEALSQLTPAVVTNKGGLPEIVKNNRWGYVVESDAESISAGIDKAIKNNRKLIRNIFNDFYLLDQKFNVEVSRNYMRIYNSLS